MAKLRLTIEGSNMFEVARQVSTLDSYFHSRGSFVTDAQISALESRVRVASGAVTALRKAMALQISSIEGFKP